MVFDDVPPDFLRRRDFSGFEREFAGQQCELANLLMRRKEAGLPRDFAFVKRRDFGFQDQILAAGPLDPVCARKSLQGGEIRHHQGAHELAPFAHDKNL